MPCPPTAVAAGGLALATLGVRGASDLAGADVPASTYAFDALSLGAGAVGALAAVGGIGRYAPLADGVGDAGGAGSAASTGAGLVQGDGDDRPFQHFVPDSLGEAAPGILLGPFAPGWSVRSTSAGRRTVGRPHRQSATGGTGERVVGSGPRRRSGDREPALAPPHHPLGAHQQHEQQRQARVGERALVQVRAARQLEDRAGGDPVALVVLDASWPACRSAARPPGRGGSP